MTAGNGGGGEGKLAGEVQLAGVGWFVGGELPVVSVATAQLRRAPGDDSVHDTEGKKGAVSAVSTGSAMEGSEGKRGAAARRIRDRWQPSAPAAR